MTVRLTLSTIAVVVNPPKELPRITDEDIRSLLNPPLSVGMTNMGQSIVTSTKDQIDVLTTPTKIEVRDLSGADRLKRTKIPRIIHAYLDWYGTQPMSYGINFILTIAPITDPDMWIGSNLVHESIPSKSGKRLLGSKSASFSLEAGQKVWNIRVTSVPKNSLEINFNSSQEINELPSAEFLIEERAEQYRQLKEFIRTLGL